jgi:hypothetical protein
LWVGSKGSLGELNVKAKEPNEAVKFPEDD